MTKLYSETLKIIRPPIEDDLKILKVEHLSNHLLDPTQILNLSLSLDEKNLFYKSLK